MPDFRALCAELLAYYEDHHFTTELRDRVCAALAEPEPQEPTDEELFDVADSHAEKHGWLSTSDAVDFARYVLDRWGK